MRSARAALLLLLCVPSRAASPKTGAPCVPGAGFRGKPPTLGEVAACQKAELEGFAETYEKKHGGPVPWDVLEKKADAQRTEVRDFLLRHPEAALVEGLPEGAAAADGEAPAGAAPPGPGGWLGKLKELAKSLRKRAELLLERYSPSAGPKSELGYALEGGDEALKAVLEKAREGGAYIEGLRRDVARDPAGTLKKSLDARERAVERSIDPAMKPFLKPEPESPDRERGGE